MVTVHAALDDRLLRIDGADGEPRATETLAGHEFECLAADGDRLFAGTVGAGLQYSPDGGDSWRGVDIEERVTSVAVGPDGRVWVGTEPTAVYRLAFDGDGSPAPRRCADLTALPGSDRWSFPPRPHTHHARWIAVHPADPGQLYVAVEAGAFVRSADGGDSWQPHPEGARRDNHTVAVHPDDPERVYVAAGDGYAESADRGATWTAPQDGLDHRYVWGLAVDAGDPDRVVVSAARGARTAHTPSTAEAYVYRRVDGGWERAMTGLPDPEGTVRAVLAAGGPGEFYALTNRGLFRSVDGAGSWAALALDGSVAIREPEVGRGLAVTR
jgi:photosystem II stability/assembly factor-like uncharacterized protein